MFTESRKLHIIEAVLKTTNEAILGAIEKIVAQDNATGKRTKARFSDLLGVLTPEEAESMKRTIEDNFEKINPDNWK
jgi:hypothetical protein